MKATDSIKPRPAKTPKSTKQEGTKIVSIKTTAKENAFSRAADALGDGLDALFNDQGAQYSMVLLEMIAVKQQIREDFEDEENTLEDLAASIAAQGLLQPILLRSTADGYELIAGERRLRAAKLAGLELIPSYIREMTDEEAEDAQMAENIHRKNLTQIEEAKKIQRDLNRLGSIEAVLEKHHKSRSWLSKILALLDLPEQAKRLVTENVSADLEVINTVKTVEKADPEKARALVDDLKDTRGKANARDKAAAVKDAVKPSKKPKAAKGDGALATTKDRSQEQPGSVKVFAGAKTKAGADGVEQGDDDEATRALATAYVNIVEHGSNPKTVLDVLDAGAKAAVEIWLRSFYDAGSGVPDVGRAVLHGLRKGEFAQEGARAFALVAFLHGVDSEAKFNVLNIIGDVKN